ncbi:MAG: phospho-sugar mutase [Flavobacteriales bacterium]|nr:phospho-sugar mutase [Flavobacteriales bacterium]
METSLELSQDILHKANAWLDSPAVDQQTKEDIATMLQQDPQAVKESFYNDLEFGTGGLRGVMGVGTMRMNKYTVGMATQGLANYILKQFPGQKNKVAIAYDSRNNSKFFSDTAAQVLSANGIEVYLFDELRPTPVLSYTVRALNCQAGIVITASHNPKEYNGYKVYWNDGAQVLPPHDKGIISEVRSVAGIDAVKFNGDLTKILSVPQEVEEKYLSEIKATVFAHEEIQKSSSLQIVYTSIHGAGITMVPRALKELGFQQISVVEEQAIPDGNFSTVASPNPEEREALSLALKLADQIGADMVLGTDPDTDRVGIAVRDNGGKLVLLNGNQSACLLVYYELMQWHQRKMFKGHEYIAKTIVTTDLLEEIARSYQVKWYDTLTGFKYIAGVIRDREGQERFIAGGEESYGYSVGEFVRDKDAVLSSVVLCEIAAWCNANGKSMWSLLMEIYEKFGLYHETLLSLTIKGLDGIEKINQMMASLRNSPPKVLGGSPVAIIRDVQSGEQKNMQTGANTKLDLPASNVLQFILEDGSKISARPSGTEPKIKFYFSMKEPLRSGSEYHVQVEKIESRILRIQQELGLIN